MGSNQGDIKSVYDIGEKIGTGGYGTVFQAIHKGSNEKRAIKKIMKSRIRNPERLTTEIEVMKLADNPYIAKLFEVWEDSRFIYLVMEYCLGGDLWSYIKKKGSLSEKEAANIFHDLLSGINYLHGNNIAHRDLKPENLLFVDENLSDSFLKICDFGISKLCSSSTPKMLSRVGTPLYIAPEVLNGTGYSFACDIWSCGVILYVFLSGTPPFFAASEGKIMEKIRNGTYDFKKSIWASISDSAKDLIKNMLIVNPQDRLTVEQALNHPWILNNQLLSDSPLPIDIHYLEEYTTGTRLRKAILLCVASQCSDQDIKNLRDIFVRLDTNNDGTLSFAELQAGISKLSTVDVQIETLLKEMDINNSGRVDYTEFLASTIEENIYLQEERLNNSFKIFDADNNGKISAVELRELLGKEGFSHQPEFWENLIHESDRNNDGEIDFSEFLELMRSGPMNNLLD